MTEIYIYIYEHEAIRIPKSENNIGAPLAPQKVVTPSAAKISSFEAIRAGMEKTVEGDEYLEFLDKILEQRRNNRELFSMGVSC